jgi:hypothetical protein
VAEIINNIPLMAKYIDEVTLDIFKRIMATDKAWFAADFIDLSNYSKVIRSLKCLEKKGIIVGKKTYPITWVRIR